MAHSYDYAVLTAIPDPRRGERANVGVVIFRPDRIDVRFEQVAYKLRALTGNNLDARMEAARIQFESMFKPEQDSKTTLHRLTRVEPLLMPSDLGYFLARDDAEYEARVSDIITSLVRVPKRNRPKSQSRLNTEMSREFRRLHILAAPSNTLDDGTLPEKKVMREYEVDRGEGLVADFALKNGKMHIACTLDLRRSSTGLSEAALKSVILDTAKKKDKKARTIGVYAVDNDMRDHLAGALHMLDRYSNDLFDWLDADSRRRLGHLFENAIGLPDGGLFS